MPRESKSQRLAALLLARTQVISADAPWGATELVALALANRMSPSSDSGDAAYVKLEQVWPELQCLS